MSEQMPEPEDGVEQTDNSSEPGQPVLSQDPNWVPDDAIDEAP